MVMMSAHQKHFYSHFCFLKNGISLAKNVRFTTDDTAERTPLAYFRL